MRNKTFLLNSIRFRMNYLNNSMVCISKQRLYLGYNKKKRVIRLTPQISGIVLRVCVRKPRKPNSSLKKICKVLVSKENKMYWSYIPGIGNNLKKNNRVLLRQIGVQDLNGVNKSVIRGALDSIGVNRNSSRSKYGCKKNATIRNK